jgi:hypothetical protein
VDAKVMSTPACPITTRADFSLKFRRARSALAASGALKFIRSTLYYVGHYLHFINSVDMALVCFERFVLNLVLTESWMRSFSF